MGLICQHINHCCSRSLGILHRYLLSVKMPESYNTDLKFKENKLPKDKTMFSSSNEIWKNSVTQLELRIIFIRFLNIKDLLTVRGLNKNLVFSKTLLLLNHTTSWLWLCSRLFNIFIFCYNQVFRMTNILQYLKNG